MGTVGSYTGGGGKDGDDLRQSLTDWLDRLPGAGSDDGGDGGEGPGDGEGQGPAEGQHPDQGRLGPRGAGPPPLDPSVLLSAVGLLRPRSRPGGGSDGPGGGGGAGGRSGTGRRGGGGASRSVPASAGTAGRAAAGAYAFATGDTETLARLGLDYDALRAKGDSFEVVREIVNSAFESAPPDSSIPDHEQRLVGADIAEWVIEESQAGHTPPPEDIVRKTIAAIVAQASLVETGHIAAEHPNGALSEQSIREAAEVLASQAQLSVDGATEDEFAQAIEDGIETLRAIQDASGK